MQYSSRFTQQEPVIPVILPGDAFDIRPVTLGPLKNEFQAYALLTVVLQDLLQDLHRMVLQCALLKLVFG